MAALTPNTNWSMPKIAASASRRAIEARAAKKVFRKNSIK
jgi:hypothetical protein